MTQGRVEIPNVHNISQSLSMNFVHEPRKHAFLHPGQMTATYVHLKKNFSFRLDFGRNYVPELLA